MGTFRKQDDRRQGLLLPPSPSDWLPKNHLAWFVIDAVDQLDIDTVLDKYRPSGKGEQAYPPRAMLALLIYSYCTSTFAARQIAAQIEDSVAFRVIAAFAIDVAKITGTCYRSFRASPSAGCVYAWHWAALCAQATSIGSVLISSQP